MSRVSQRRRERVRNRAHGRCEYCQTPEEYSPSSFDVEHIIPLALDGTDDEANLAFCCGGCNNAKGIFVSAIDQLSGESVRLFHPREHRWDDHFAWSDDGDEIRGVTASVERRLYAFGSIVQVL